MGGPFFDPDFKKTNKQIFNGDFNGYGKFTKQSI